MNSNETVDEYEEMLKKSKNQMEMSRKINLIGSMIVILIGLIGNFLICLVFARKKLRSNSSHIYLFCSSVNDNLFFIVHILEDVLKTFKAVYSMDNNYLVNLLNITDENDFFCRFVNYLRNVLRFVSVYLLVAFTAQRAAIVYWPLSSRFKRKKLAWQTISIIIVISLILNSWAPFLFQISTENNQKYCEININYKKEYFFINIVYICLIMILPMIQIVLCNSLIIIKTFKNNQQRKKLQTFKLKNKKKPNETKTFLDIVNTKEIKPNLLSKSGISAFITDESTKNKSSNLRIKPYYMACDKMITNKGNKKKGSSKKLTLMLLIISFSFVVLNFPYLFEWIIFFYKTSTLQMDAIERNSLIMALQISEILYVMNYGLKFFVYSVISKVFREKLKNLSKSP